MDDKQKAHNRRIADLQKALNPSAMVRVLVATQDQCDELRAALEDLLELTERPPEANCFCHLSPPCGDCVDYGALREAVKNAEAVIARAKGGKA